MKSDIQERFVNYDAWFLAEVEKGLAAAERGELIEHEGVLKLIESDIRITKIPDSSSLSATHKHCHSDAEHYPAEESRTA